MIRSGVVWLSASAMCRVGEVRVAAAPEGWVGRGGTVLLRAASWFFWVDETIDLTSARGPRYLRGVELQKSNLLCTIVYFLLRPPCELYVPFDCCTYHLIVSSRVSFNLVGYEP